LAATAAGGPSKAPTVRPTMIALPGEVLQAQMEN
jgi:hypothetical protein